VKWASTSQSVLYSYLAKSEVRASSSSDVGDESQISDASVLVSLGICIK